MAIVPCGRIFGRIAIRPYIGKSFRYTV